MKMLIMREIREAETRKGTRFESRADVGPKRGYSKDIHWICLVMSIESLKTRRVGASRCALLDF
ncbi:hypothetical protein Syun_003585 [Stephania yunnanensis]|uniref:Uncharacterized protein n=1 Tax=Stephania yunnanensis TaxID=152371 RepID=A0AAP0Q0C7_9MAGN